MGKNAGSLVLANLLLVLILAYFFLRRAEKISLRLVLGAVLSTAGFIMLL